MQAALLLLALLAPVAARRHPPDLREDEPARRTTRPAECQFGKQAKELGSSWFADLGPPFGVMYCIKCECTEVQKKRRIVAKVHCRNIKNECPEPSCDSPVLLPGRCCKTCPGDTTPDLVQEDTPQSVPDEEEFSNKHFGALLTGRSPLCIRRDDMSGVPLAPGVATARFIFRRRHLYWSVLLGTSMTTKPRALAFLDKTGRLLLEHPLKKSPGLHETYETRTDKLCGVWRRVPREYKRLLREGVLYVALIWGDEKNGTMDSALSGRINKYPALSTEMFTTLLEPEERPVDNGGSACDDARGLAVQESGWWGGTAVVTGVAGAAPSLHIGIMYNGVFAPNSHEHTVRITLTMPDKNITTTIIDELHNVPKPGYEMNILEVRTPVSAAQLRSLARGKLVLAIESTAVPERKISGTVRQRAACEVYHAPLLAERLPATVYPEGLAMVYIDKEGSLVYDIQFDNIGYVGPKITLVEEQATKKGRRHSQVEILDTKSGVFIRPSARIFPPLYDDQLAVHIGVDIGPPILRGRLVSRPLPDASGSGPALLRRTDARTPLKAPITNPIAGLAWLSIDSLCGLHYEVLVNGIIEDGWTTWLETHTAGEGNTRPLGGAEGCLLEPSGHELAALNAGAAYIDVRVDNITALLRTRIPQIIVPPSCLSSVPWNNDNNELSPTNFNPPSDNTLPNSAVCYHSGRTYEDGAQWKPSDECQMCECVQGAVRCEDVVCPYVGQHAENVLGSHCSVPVIRPAGQCCPICTNSTTAVWNESHGCHLSGHYYAPGSSWHPYLLPGGYDLCTVCTCDFSTRVVRCLREPCPPLKCSERDAYRPDKEACCRVCPETKTKNEEETLKDEGTPKTAEEILAEGGCVFPNGPLPNGKEVHPSIHSHGEQRCVTCRCKDGELKCQRKRCGRGVCSKRRSRHDSCCACPRPRRVRKPRPEPPPRAPPPS